MKVAAYQAPLAPGPINQVLSLIRKQIDRCETLGVEILCCPEAVLGGLADYVERPSEIAIDGSGDGPTNNGMPPDKGGAELVAEARASDIANARRHGVPIIRADVAGQADGFVSYGSSAIIDRNGNVRAAAPPGQADLLVGNVENL